MVEALRHYSSLRQYVDLRLIVLLSHEQLSNKTKQIYESVRAESASLPTLAVETLTCPTLCVSKAHKLQFLFTDPMASQFVLSDDAWIMVVDVDSRFCCPPAFTRLPMQKDRPHILQALPFPLPASSGITRLAQFMAIAQAERTAMEHYALCRWDSDGKRRPFMMGLMGAAMLFNRHAIRSLLPWPLDSDDIRVGYRADLLRISRSILPSFVAVRPAPTLTDWWTQNLKIAAGVQTRFAEAKAILPKKNGAILAVIKSSVFDWLPGLRLISGLITAATLLNIQTALGATFMVVFLIINGVPCFVAIGRFSNEARLSNAFSRFAMSVVGSLAWPVGRTAAAIVAGLSPRASIEKLRASATKKS